jgi:hypothetical protein
MLELENPLLIPGLLGALVVLQLLVLAMLLRLSGRVTRLSRRVAPQVPPAGKELGERMESNADQKKSFAFFLAEDPSRKELPKKEQFAAFRRWRDEKGMNWKSPPDAE